MGQTWIAVLCCLASCAASIDQHQDTWGTAGATSASRGVRPTADAGVPTGPRRAVAPPRLTLTRSEVDAVLSRGLQPFVASIDVEAVLVERRFVGWRIVRFPPTASPSALDIVEEDVVTRVNDLPVERPGDWVRIWDELRRAPELRIEFLRGGELKNRRIPILRD